MHCHHCDSEPDNQLSERVNVMWSVAALFQITRFLSNYVVLRHKLQTPPL